MVSVGIRYTPVTGVAPTQSTSPWDDHYLASTLEQVREEFGMGSWSSSYWTFAEMFRTDLADHCGIEDNQWGEHRRDFLACVRPTVKGAVYVDGDGAAKFVSRYRCYDPHCPDCRDYDRDRQAHEYLDLIKKVVELHPGARKVWRFQFTLDQGNEARPFDDAGFQKHLLDGIHRIVRSSLGFSSRSNLPVIFAVHPVGDSDFYRDRWHVHCVVLPCEIVGGRLRWSSVDWMDVEALYTNWCSVVDAQVIPPQVSYVDLTKEGWQGLLFEKLRYDLRGFGKDLDKAVKATNKVCHFVAVHHPEGYRVVESEDLANRYLWVRKHNVVRTWGFLRCIDRYSEVLGFTREDLKPEAPSPDLIEVPAEVTLVRLWTLGPRGKPVFVKEEIYLYRCPIRSRVVALVRSKEVDLVEVDDHVKKLALGRSRRKVQA